MWICKHFALANYLFRILTGNWFFFCVNSFLCHYFDLKICFHRFPHLPPLEWNKQLKRLLIYFWCENKLTPQQQILQFNVNSFTESLDQNRACFLTEFCNIYFWFIKYIVGCQGLVQLGDLVPVLWQ